MKKLINDAHVFEEWGFIVIADVTNGRLHA
jgi:hypothetical protein